MTNYSNYTGELGLNGIQNTESYLNKKDKTLSEVIQEKLTERSGESYYPSASIIEHRKRLDARHRLILNSNYLTRPTDQQLKIKKLTQSCRSLRIIEDNDEVGNLQYNDFLTWGEDYLYTFERFLLDESLDKEYKINLLKAYSENKYNIYNRPQEAPTEDYVDGIKVPSIVVEKIIFHDSAAIINDPAVIDRAKSYYDSYKSEFDSYGGKDEKVEENQLLKEVKKATIRVAATQINKATKGLMVSALSSLEQATTLEQFLNSELGTSFVSMINGMALTYGLKDNENAKILAKEFRISGMTTAGNFAMEEIIGLVADVVNTSMAEQDLISVLEGAEREDIQYDESEEDNKLLTVT